ncbi:putative adenylylsulfate reductase alpha subunit [Clostridium sp. CAG:590]|nr:putative adenylylsulfate reductase alpha subunit [Clostridium sp. CAG:590]
MERLQVRRIQTDVLIVGGGTAGCYAALTISRNSNLSVLIAEKANIKRSGCLAAGVNAINAYITKGHVPQDYVDYATKDAAGIVRGDLLLTAAEHFNEVTEDMERLGLVILKDENGDYVARGNRNIKINGENFKPILAKAVEEADRVEVLNHINITDLLVEDNRVYGAVGFSVTDEAAYEIRANAVLIATGGAAGLYRPNNPGFSRHKMWYPPFNTGAGYAMGIRAGAEMTSFEMRFIALRCKDTIAPTGTIAQGVGAKQVNSRGTVYEKHYGLTTSERVYGTVRENQLGHGPCYLQTSGITEKQNEELLKAYLNMAPSQTLRWIETGKMPKEQDVEIQGTEPYIVGGHTASGFWIDTNRQTTIHGLYAAGDVAGGCPQKYVTGALAEGEIAAVDIIRRLEENKEGWIPSAPALLQESANRTLLEYEKIRATEQPAFTIEELEEAMQKVMDEYAGGITTGYQYNENQLQLADEKIDQIIALTDHIGAKDMHELLFVYELKERLVVCKSLIAHLRGRKETRWHAFNENQDYPETDEAYYRYLNSRMRDGKIELIWRDIVKEGEYEHTN